MRKVVLKLWFLRDVIFAWLLVAAWMMIIFFFSAQPAELSAELSGGLTSWLVSISKTLPGPALELQAIHGNVRKHAHFLVYLVLGLLVIRALTRQRPLNRKSVLIALLICLLYAVSDEVHQVFVPGRSGQISDVFLDSAGSAAGILIFIWLRRLRQKSGKKQSISTDS